MIVTECNNIERHKWRSCLLLEDQQYCPMTKHLRQIALDGRGSQLPSCHCGQLQCESGMELFKSEL